MKTLEKQLENLYIQRNKIDEEIELLKEKIKLEKEKILLKKDFTKDEKKVSAGPRRQAQPNNANKPMKQQHFYPS